MITFREINRLDNISRAEVEQIVDEYENLRMEISLELPDVALPADYDKAAYTVCNRYLDGRTIEKIHAIAAHMSEENEKFWEAYRNDF